jgi:hypothetical protein
MPKPSRRVLQRHAEEMAQEYSSRVGMPVLTIVGLILSGLNLALRFCTTRESGVGKMRSTLRQSRDNDGQFRPRLVARVGRQFQTAWQKGGHYLNHATSLEMARDALQRERDATDEDVAEAVGEAWEGDE